MSFICMEEDERRFIIRANAALSAKAWRRTGKMGCMILFARFRRHAGQCGGSCGWLTSLQFRRSPGGSRKKRNRLSRRPGHSTRRRAAAISCRGRTRYAGDRRVDSLNLEMRCTQDCLCAAIIPLSPKQPYSTMYARGAGKPGLCLQDYIGSNIELLDLRRQHRLFTSRRYRSRRQLDRDGHSLV